MQDLLQENLKLHTQNRNTIKFIFNFFMIIFMFFNYFGLLFMLKEPKS